MPRKEPFRRVRIGEALCLGLERKLGPVIKKGDISSFVEGMCHKAIDGEFVTLPNNLAERLKKVQASMKRKEDFSLYVEWICETFLDQVAREKTHVKN